MTTPVAGPRWTTAADVRDHLNKLWQRGDLLASEAQDTNRFPLRITLKGPTSEEWGSRFDEARRWVADLRAIPRVRVLWRQVNHRQLGLNEVPSQLWVDTLDDAAALINRTVDVRRFRSIVALTAAQHRALLPVIAKRPLDAIAAADDWSALLAIVDWIVGHPKPGVYLRQLDLPGVHTKMVEHHSRLLSMMLDVSLVGPDDDTPLGAAQPNDFARRFGFRSRPRLVRFRSLDPMWRLTTFDQGGDYTLTATDFARLPPPERVFITENEVNFLAFPEVPQAIVIFGAGSGMEHLGAADWLTTVPVLYWGDIDTHGFWILDQLRAVVPAAESMLMDRATLMAHERFWGTEAKRMLRNLTRLTLDEQHLYDDLRDQRIRPDLRLEQERVRFSHLRHAVDELTR